MTFYLEWLQYIDHHLLTNVQLFFQKLENIFQSNPCHHIDALNSYIVNLQLDIL